MKSFGIKKYNINFHDSYIDVTRLIKINNIVNKFC